MSKRDLTAIATAALVTGADAVRSNVRKGSMRRLAFAIMALVSVSATGPAQAQRYDPDFPFCMHVYERRSIPRQDCAYYTMEQCRASASGRGFACDPNPYYVGTATTPGRYKKRHRRVD